MLGIFPTPQSGLKSGKGKRGSEILTLKYQQSL